MNDWIKHWAGGWSILTSTYLGEQYTQLLKETLGHSLNLSLFVSKKGFTTCSLEKEDHHRFGTVMAEKIIQDQDKAKEWSIELKAKTDIVLKLISQLKGIRISREDYNKFIEAMLDYGSPHRAVKIAVDFLPAEILEKHLPVLSEARVYAEPVYEKTEEFMQKFAAQLSQVTNYAQELILAMTKDEIELYLEKGKLPSKSSLEERFKAAAIVFESGKYQVLTGKDVLELENQIEAKLLQNSQIKGSTAYPGKVVGKVRIIMKADQEKEFNPGDILVSGMTRPEFQHLFEKAGAVVTNAGGILCHAAIVAREMKKPCIVGTEIATKVLKDGDMIEVDADNGIVRKGDKK